MTFRLRLLRFVQRDSTLLFLPYMPRISQKGNRQRHCDRTEMADSEATQPTKMVEDNENRLKYLDFVQMAAIYIIVCFSTLYEFAKETAGPLKSGVQTVEDHVKTVIGPVCEKFHDVPFELLKFIDRKVDESLSEFDRHLPPLVKQASNQAITLAQKAPEAARAVASEVHSTGVVGTAANVTKAVYSKYEPVAEKYAMSAWRSLNSFPLFSLAAQIVVPTAAYWSEKYNETVSSTLVGAYLPLIPVDRIRKVFEEAESEAAFSSDGEGVAEE